MSHQDGAYLGGIRTVEDIRARCFVDECTDCWHWRQAISQGSPSIHFVTPQGKRVKMRGRRAALLLQRGHDLLPGHAACATAVCESLDCVNPDHCRSGTRQQIGEAHRRSGRAKAQAKTEAARAQAEKRRKLKAAQVMEIRASHETDAALAARFGVSRFCIWSARKGKSYPNLPPVASSVFDWRP